MSGSSTYGAKGTRRSSAGLTVSSWVACASVGLVVSFCQSGYEVDRRCDDHRAHGERQPRVPQRGPPYLPGPDVGVGDLEGHADREGQVGEVAVVRGRGLVEVDAPGTADNGSDPGIAVYGPFPVHGLSGNNNFIEADGDPSYSFTFSQTISTLTVGQNYTVSFDQAAGQQSGNLVGPTTEQWKVSLGSSTQFSSLMSTPQGGIFPWEAQTLAFTASSTSEVLSFLAVGTPSGAPPMVFLDGVDMEPSVPEPSALLLLEGVGAVIAIGRLGRRVRANRISIAA